MISRPDQYVGIVTYLGNGTTGQSITGLNFDSVPDLVYIKERNATGSPLMFDTVRGAPLALQTRAATPEYNIAETLTSFDRNGFSVDYDGSSTSIVVNRTNNYVAWCWKAGGNPGISTTAFWKDGQEYASAAAAGMNGGSITPIGASVGTKQGFSIISYRANLTTGATISHGLTQKPDFALFKNRDSNLGTDEVDWGVYHTVVGATKRLELNQTLAEQAFSGPFNDTEPTSSVFTFGGGSQGHSYLTNGPSGDRFVGYIWHNVPGLQKFGSFEGNGNANGPFVELGFEPAVVILKNIDNYGSGYNWFIFDNQRDKNNPCSSVLIANGGDAASSTDSIDFLSNGFKIRATTNGINLNAHTIVYAAWAAAPSIDLYGGGANAR